ncbi:MAG: holo-ACP synthase [Rhizobacter sp.]|nr:holo-ACP synthase [Chlorobiales bacterium]
MNIGIDIIEVARIELSHAKYGRKFLERVLTDSEIAYCLSKSNPFESIAARFACKEAIGKALGTGISKDFGFHSVEISNDKFGKPVVKVRGKVKGLLRKKIHLSLSHTHDYAVAVAVIEP